MNVSASVSMVFAQRAKIHLANSEVDEKGFKVKDVQTYPIAHCYLVEVLGTQLFALLKTVFLMVRFTSS